MNMPMVGEEGRREPPMKAANKNRRWRLRDCPIEAIAGHAYSASLEQNNWSTFLSEIAKFDFLKMDIILRIRAYQFVKKFDNN